MIRPGACWGSEAWGQAGTLPRNLGGSNPSPACAHLPDRTVPRCGAACVALGAGAAPPPRAALLAFANSGIRIQESPALVIMQLTHNAAHDRVLD